VTLTPAMQKLLDRVGPNARELFDHKLALLQRLDDCLGDRLSSDGRFSLFLHYAVDTRTSKAQPDGITIESSTLAPEDDALVTECLDRARTNLPLVLSQAPDSGDYHWSTELTFPIQRDWARRFVRGEVL
jgi:hypothetical protein